MDVINNKYNIKAEILTPVNIGVGREKDWIKGLDYVESNGFIYKLSLHKMLQSGIDIAQLTDCLREKNEAKLLQLVKNRLDCVSEKKLKSPVNSNNDIKAFVCNELSECPIIPGSSIKGAIRSILYKYLSSGKQAKEAQIFGSSEKGDEFMRFIKFTDIEFLETGLVNTKIFNLRSEPNKLLGGWKHKANSTTYKFNSTGFNTVYEVLLPGQNAYGSLMLSEKLFNLYGEKHQLLGDAKKIIIENNYHKLFSIINRHTQLYLQKELAFFNKYEAMHSNYIVDNIEYLLQQIRNVRENECILKMAAGAGFHIITGDWQFDDYSITDIKPDRGKNRGFYKGKPSSKSRKIALWNNGFQLMGFIKLCIVTEEEAALKSAQQREIQQQRLFAKRESIRKKQEQLQQIEKYRTLMCQASAFFEQGDYSSAQHLLEEAETLPVDRNDHIELQHKVEEELNKQELIEKARIREKQEKEAEAQRRKSQIEGGLSFLQEKFPNGKYKVLDFKGLRNRVDQWMKKAELSILPQDQYNILIESLNRIYATLKPKEKKDWAAKGLGIWKDVTRWTGEEYANKVFDEITK